MVGGAGDRNRTNNLLITNQLLCRLSYTGKVVPWGGIEPPKSETSDLQSDPFGRSGIFPCYEIFAVAGAGGRNRTCNLLITNQLLCQLSYTGKVVPWGGIEPPTDGFSVRCSTN